MSYDPLSLEGVVLTDAMPNPFGGVEMIVPPHQRARRSFGRYLVHHLGRDLFVAVVLVVVAPLLMIGFFNLQAPELYALPPVPAFCLCP